MKRNFVIILLTLVCHSCTGPVNVTSLFGNPPSLLICTLWVVWAILIARRAGKLGRNWFLWFLISLCITPIVTWIILEIMGQGAGNDLQDINNNLGEAELNSIKKKPENPIGCAILAFIVGFVVVVVFNLTEAISRGLNESRAYGDNDAITRNTNSVYLSALFFAVIIAIIVYTLQKSKKNAGNKYKRADIIPEWKGDKVKTGNEDVRWQDNTKSARTKEKYFNENWEESRPIQPVQIKEKIEEQDLIVKQETVENTKPVETRDFRTPPHINFNNIFNPFQKLPLGYYRLFLAGWLFGPFAIAILAWTITFFCESHRYYSSQSENASTWFFIALLTYYPIMRIILWVWEGFQQSNDHGNGNQEG